MEAKNHDVAIAYVLGGILFLLTAWIYWDYYHPPWKAHQTEFRALITRRFGAEKARQVPAGLQQIWTAELNRVDRCVSCHLGVEWEGLEDSPNPYRSHPQAILRKHPVARFGCTICHGGQGFATDVESAHATAAPHWEEPLLYAELGRKYQIDDPKALLEINCNVCHRYDAQTEGADYINYAKQLVREKRCSLCHKINGQGGIIGPDLTYVGDKSPENFDYMELRGKPSAFGWHVAHFKDPKAVEPATVMPNLNLGGRETQALAMLMMSWKRADLPAAYIPPPKEEPVVTEK